MKGRFKKMIRDSQQYNNQSQGQYNNQSQGQYNRQTQGQYNKQSHEQYNRQSQPLRHQPMREEKRESMREEKPVKKKHEGFSEEYRVTNKTPVNSLASAITRRLSVASKLNVRCIGNVSCYNAILAIAIANRWMPLSLEVGFQVGEKEEGSDKIPNILILTLTKQQGGNKEDILKKISGVKGIGDKTLALIAEAI